ncbi:MAG TPA: hypothetical protein PKC24_07690 [Cyclobacteriaceae bacterium]|nr:hypothetical protein [Cyclobacteriaceae bacterium]
MEEEIITIEIVNYKKRILHKIVSYIYVVVFVILLGSMISGPVGSGDSLYKRWDVPAWVYFTTSVAVFLIAILGINHVLSNNSSAGQIKFLENLIVIHKGRKEFQLEWGSIKNINILPDYNNTPIATGKLCRKLEINTKKESLKFDVNLSKEEESILEELFKQKGIIM